MNYVDFFSKLGFDFKNDLKTNSIEIERNPDLNEKLKDSVFYLKIQIILILHFTLSQQF